MKYSFYASLTANVTFSDEDWAFLLNAFKHHYDGTIKAAVELGGWMYGMNNRRAFSNGECKEAELSERQLGYVMKSIEFDNSDQARILGKELMAVVKDMRLTHSQLNDILSKK